MPKIRGKTGRVEIYGFEIGYRHCSLMLGYFYMSTVQVRCLVALQSASLMKRISYWNVCVSKGCKSVIFMPSDGDGTDTNRPLRIQSVPSYY